MEITPDIFPKQQEAFIYLMDDSTNELLYGGCAGGGKSRLGCMWIIISALKYHQSRWLIGRSVLKTLKETTLVTLFDTLSDWNIRPDQHYYYNTKDNYIQFKKPYGGSIILLKDLFAYPSDPEFDSLGSLEITGAFIDEGNQITEKCKNIVNSRIRYKLDKFGLIPKLLITCNPAKNWVYNQFYRPHVEGKLPPHRKFLQAFAKENPYISPHYLDNLDKLDPVSKARLRDGIWEYDDDETVLMDFDSISNVFHNEVPPAVEWYITCDYARFGKDKTVILVWNGWRVEDYKVMLKSSIPDAVEAIRKFMGKYSVSKNRVVVDEDGAGCLTRNTEVLTGHGWMKIQDINPGDRVYSKNKDGTVSIETVKGNTKREETEIIELHNNYKFSFSHFLPRKSRLDYNFKLKSWQQITKEKQIYLDNDFNWTMGHDYDFVIPEVILEMPNGGHKSCSPKKIISGPHFASFMGWFLSEGCIDNKYIRITQSHDGKIHDIERMLSNCKFNYYIKNRKRTRDYIICNKNLKNWLYENCYADKAKRYTSINKKVPDFIKTMNRDGIQSFLKAYMLGDGWLHHGLPSYATSSKRMADDILELVYKSGKYGNIRIKHKKGSESYIDKRKIKRTENCYCVYEWKSKNITMIPFIKRQYIDHVYNLEITGKTKLFMVRFSDNRAFWVHNGGVKDVLRCQGFVNNSTPVIVKGEKENYANLKSQCWYKFAQKVNRGEVLFKTEDVNIIGAIIEELEQIRRKDPDKDGKLAIEGKDVIRENIGRSPDYGDAMMMRVFFDIKKFKRYLI